MTAWSTGLFDIGADVKTFLLSCLGPCQLAYQRAHVWGHDCSIMDLIFVGCCPVWNNMWIRRRLRGKYGIDGSWLEDVLVSHYCAICAIAQQARELRAKGVKPVGFLMDA